MEPTGSGDDIITNSIHVIRQFILSYCKYLYKERCFFCFFSPSAVNSLGAADLRVEFDKIVITRAKRRSLDLSFSREGLGGGPP